MEKLAKKIKVLFLDIDGVVNCVDTNFKTDLWPLDRYMAFLIGNMVDKLDVKVVLSSSWRNHPEGVATVKKHICPVFDVTRQSWYDKDTNHHSTRGEEIQVWLDQHPEVEAYAIVDDDSDMLPAHKPNFFKTTWLHGVTPEIIADIEKHLTSGK